MCKEAKSRQWRKMDPLKVFLKSGNIAKWGNAALT